MSSKPSSRRLSRPASTGLWVVASALAGIVAALLFTAAAHAAPRSLEGLVNINTATAQELQLLPGIGPAKAQRVIDYRTGHPFRTIEELARVKGIGPKTVRKLRPHLTVRGATTARAVTAPAPAPAPAAEPPS
jgi:competence protein ComEA